MKKLWKAFWSVVLPLTGLSALLGACSSMSSCNNDSCYDRNISSVDPYKKGEIAAWGTEKEVAEKEEKANREPISPVQRRQ